MNKCSKKSSLQHCLVTSIMTNQSSSTSIEQESDKLITKKSVLK